MNERFKPQYLPHNDDAHVSSPQFMYHFSIEFLELAVSFLGLGEGGCDCTAHMDVPTATKIIPAVNHNKKAVVFNKLSSFIGLIAIPVRSQLFQAGCLGPNLYASAHRLRYKVYLRYI